MSQQNAAKCVYARSPTLVRAVSQRFPPTRANKIIAWILALIIPCLFYIGPAMVLLVPILLFYSVKASLILLIIDFILMTYPHKPWPRFRSIFELWYELFDLHHNLIANDTAHLTEEEISQLRICAMHPHGVIPFQAFLWMAFCSQYLPTQYGFGAAATVVTRIPLLRQVLCWGSAGPASRGVLYQKMSQGQNLFLLPGGLAEMFSSRPKTHVVKATRHGLMKLALQTGASLVPVYVFGGNDFYHQVGFEEISRRHRAAFMFFWGQYGSPLPYPVKCSMVLGDPVEAEKVANPTPQQIEELLKRYVNELQRVFDQYKAQAGYPNAQLEIR